MPLRLELALHVLEAEFTDPQFTIRNPAVLFRERRLIPRRDLKLAKSQRLDRDDR